MIDDGIRKAQEVIEQHLAEAKEPVKADKLLETIRREAEDIRDINLREAVWILIGSGIVILTPQREIFLKDNDRPSPLVD